MSFLISMLAALICGSYQASAQSDVDSDGRRVVITNSNGEDVLKIFANEDEGNTVLSFATFDIQLNGIDKQFSEMSFGEKKTKKKVTVGKSKYLSFFEIGMNSFPSVDYSLYQELPDGLNYFMDLRSAKSLQFNFTLWKLTMYLNESKTLAFTAGLQLCFNDYVFSGNMRLTKENGMLVPEAISPHYKKSKMTTTSLQIPVLFSIGKSRSFNFSAGVYGGVLLGSHSKIKFPKEKMYDLYMSPFYGGVTARAGYRGVYVYANYGLSEMFRQGKGPGVMPLTIGLGFGF